MKPGRAGTMTRDYKRRGTTNLFAAMNIATREVLYDTKRSHKATDMLASFKLVDLHVPRHLEVHLVPHNLSAHTAEPIVTSLAHRKSAHWHIHFTPTSSSWLNLFAGRFCPLTERRRPRGPFNMVDDLVTAIETRAEHWHDDPKPFLCKKLDDEIVSRVKRGRSTATSAKSVTHH